MRKRSIAIMMLAVFLSSDVASAASSVVGVRSINNSQRQIDYKVSTENVQKQADSLVVDSSTKEVIGDSIERDSGTLTIEKVNGAEGSGVFSESNFAALTTGLSDKELNWLISNNIVSRDPDIKIDKSGVIVGLATPLYDRNQPTESANRTEFLTGVYKALYGVIESRPLVFNLDSWREAAEIKYVEKQVEKEVDGVKTTVTEKVRETSPVKRQIVSGTGKDYLYRPSGKTEEAEGTFDEGDYFTYVSPNVYELYLKELVDKKIIDINSLKDQRFKTAYAQVQGVSNNNAKIYPAWYQDLAPFMVLGGKDQPNDFVDLIKNSRVLGKSYIISGVGDGQKRGNANAGSVINIHKNTPSYFANEAVDSMSALKYVESMLRLTEKDMTDTEARIVTYKYGANYLDGLVDEDRKTVMFLTAKGILNFEDPTEYRNLYGNLTKEFQFKLLYRLANKDARTKFSEIQLTDSDNFWLQKGFSSLELSLNTEKLEVGADLKNESGQYIVSPIPDAITESVEVVGQGDSNDGDEDGNVETTSIFGIKVRTKVSNFAAPAVNQYEITKVFDDYRKYRYKGVNMTSKEFNKTKFPEMTSAAVPVGAKSKYQWRVVYKVNANNATVAIRTVDGNLSVATDSLFSTKSVTAVTKYTENGTETVLVPASSFKKVTSDIIIMEDKLLKNRNTGNTAILLQDKNIALVGTHVVQSEDIMVTAIDGEIYYNLDIIKMLLSNAYISKLDPQSIYLTKNIYDETLVNVKGSTDNVIGQTYVAGFKGKFAGGGDPGAQAATVKSDFVNISQMTTATNFLIREFTKKDMTGKGEDLNFTMVMHLYYKLPNKDVNFTAPAYDSPNPTINAVNNFLLKRPDDKQLADWWDNNIALSNAFANIIYGTSEVEYVKSGYLVPNISILYDKENVKTDGYIGQVLKEVGGELPSSWVSRFMGDSKTYNTIPDGTGKHTDAKNGKSFYYPVPDTLNKGEYPLWAYAMFNNDNAQVNGSAVGSTTPATFKNSTLWRSLMADRRLDVAMGVPDIEQGSISYNTGNTVYVKTRADVIYRMVDENNTQFPVSYDGKKTVKVETRTAEEQRDYWEKSYITAYGYKFYVSKISGNSMDLVDTAMISGKPVASTKNGKASYEINGKTTYANGKSNTATNYAIATRYKELRKIFSPVSLSALNYDKAMTEFNDAGAVTGKLPSNATKDAVYFMDAFPAKGYTAASKPFKEYTSDNKVLPYTFDQAKAKVVNAHVKVTLDLNYWTITEQGVLVARKTSPYLQVGNVFYSGLNQGLTDAMISKAVSSVSVNKLESGSTLLVGDMEFIKSGNVFVSKPQTNIASWKSLISDATNASTVKSTINKNFVGMMMRVSNKNIPLTNYITEQGLGVPTAGMTLDKTLIGNDSSSTVAYTATTTKAGGVNKGVYSKQKVPVVKSVVFKIALSDILLARPVDTETKKYQLLMTTNSLSEGYLENIPFFGESLSLGVKDDLFLMLDKANFNPVAKAGDLKHDFLEMHEMAFRGDVYSWLRMTAVYFLSFMIVMSWISYMIVTNKLGYGFFDILRNPIRGSARKGIDLVKVFSLGVYNLDTEVPFYRIAVSNLLMFVIIYILLDVAKIGSV